MQTYSNFIRLKQLNGSRCRKMATAAGPTVISKHAILKLFRCAGNRLMLPDHCRFFTQSGSTCLRPRYFCTKTTIGFRQQMDNTVPPKEYKWVPGHLINENFRLGPNGHVCMVLNRQINVPAHVVQLLWKNATIRCAIDGGSNRWRSFMMTHAAGHQIKDEEETNKDGEQKVIIEPPDLITGDFDSITQDTVEFFKTIPKISTPDQDDTDFTKAFTVLQPVMEQRKLHDVIVFTECSGRLDHTMANLNTLHKMQKDKCNVYLVSGDSITWLLRPGKHTIQIPLDLVTEQRWCSLMPLGSAAHNVTTTGLKWNLYHAQMEFGGMVSTSNSYSTEFVQIQTDSNLIWSMGAYDFEDIVNTTVT